MFSLDQPPWLCNPRGSGLEPRASELSKRSERRKDLLIVRLVPRIVEHFAVPDDPVLVEHEYGTFGDPFEADHVLVEHAVLADRLLVEVAEERKRELLVIAERLQREKRVHADAEHLSVRLVELRERVAERAEFFGADRAERGRKKRQHH